MSSQGPGQADERDAAPSGDGAHTPLDRFLDGLMSADEAAQFQARLAADPALSREVSLQRRMDDRLRVLLAPPARIELPATARAEGVVATIGAAGAPALPARPARPSRWMGLVAAASLALLAGSGGAYWWFVIGSEAPFRQPAQIYQAQAAQSFTPEWVCTTDEEFVRNVRERFSQPALLPLATTGVEIIGWAYNTPVLSNRTATLMTRVDGREVLVLIDRAERDVNLRRAGEAAGAPSLHLFKRRLGDLVLYEVTPLDRARVIPAFVAGEP